MAESTRKAGPPRWLIRASAPIAMAISGRRWFPLFAVIHHRGRRSGTAYSTPIAVVPTRVDGALPHRTAVGSEDQLGAERARGRRRDPDLEGPGTRGDGAATGRRDGGRDARQAALQAGRGPIPAAIVLRRSIAGGPGTPRSSHRLRRAPLPPASRRCSVRRKIVPGGSDRHPNTGSSGLCPRRARSATRVVRSPSCAFPPGCAAPSPPSPPSSS